MKCDLHSDELKRLKRLKRWYIPITLLDDHMVKADKSSINFFSALDTN